MRKLALGAALAASVAVSGCSTYGSGYGYDPYYNNGYYEWLQQRHQTATTRTAISMTARAGGSLLVP